MEYLNNILSQELTFDNFFTCVRTKKYGQQWSLKDFACHRNSAIEELVKPIIDNNDDSAKSNEMASISAYMDEKQIWHLCFIVSIEDSTHYHFSISILKEISNQEQEEIYNNTIAYDQIEKELSPLFENVDIIRSFFNYVNIIHSLNSNIKCCFNYIRSSVYDIASGSNILVVTPEPLTSDRLKKYALILTSIMAPYLIQRRDEETIKSAKAAIMSRNMSHNLGSHVMFYIKQKLNSVQKMLAEDVLKDLYPDNLEGKAEELKNKNFEMPFLVGLGRFINYLQERQDYIATIATDYIPANSTISFKDFIYDELKPDLRYKRHKERMSSSSETKGYQPKNLLMDYIAYSEDYIGSEQIIMKFENFTGEEPKPQDEAQNISFSDLRKFDIALPGGVIGRQAFFSIIENIIRNAAKHSRRRTDGYLEIDFNVINPYADDDWWKGLLYKDYTPENLKALYQEASDKYYILAITNNMPNDPEAINNLAAGLNEDYVDEKGNMKDSNKGLKEIRISAAWIRNYTIDTDIPPTEPPAVSIKKIQFQENSNYCAIRYYICIPRPKKIAFLVDKDFAYSKIIEKINKQQEEDIDKTLRQKGCQIYKPTTYTYQELADYDVVVFCSNSLKELEIIPYLSARYIPYSKNAKIITAILKNLQNHESDELSTIIDSVYKLWYTDVVNTSEDTFLCILDEKAYDKQENTLKLKEHHEKNNIKLGDTSIKDVNYYKDAIIFSTHYKGLCKEREREYLYKEAKFVEGITGNNSTDRLIRQNEWTAEWKYKHLAAGLMRIAIFDERIFSSIMPLKNTTLPIIDKSTITNFVEFFFNTFVNNITEKDFFNKFYKKFIAYRSANVIQEICGAIKPALKKQAKKDIIDKIEFLINKENSKKEYLIDKAQMYHEKRVWAYDIICHDEQKDEHGNIKQKAHIDIIGYNAPIHETIEKFEEAKRKVCKIGSITKEADEMYNVEFEQCSNGGIFDLISIHQGILDKIYGVFKIEKAEEKCKITHALHKFLSKKETPENPNDFLPQFIIHSGRSKPNNEDMPQRQPFIQFAAIDHAVRDCKYTLSELLLSAHYEKDYCDNKRK